jgi:triphosphoribosyl-dephospho-CoA synthase
VTLSPAAIASAVEHACLLEASAAKPGNVSPGRPFHDMRYEDFVASAAAIGPAFLEAGSQTLGATILAATQATRQVTTANTNLGIVLLLAPLARAALGHPEATLRDGVRRVLAATTLEDARLAYQAIRLASPGGLGRADAEDVSAEPTVTLAEAMRLAAGRDAVASEWATGFQTTFEVGAPALARAREAGLVWDQAVTETFLTLLAHQPDTLIARKLGMDAALAVRDEARAIVAVDPGSPARASALARFDASLRDDANRRNPGATADLTAAAIFVVIIGRDSRPG